MRLWKWICEDLQEFVRIHETLEMDSWGLASLWKWICENLHEFLRIHETFKMDSQGLQDF